MRSALRSVMRARGTRTCTTMRRQGWSHIGRRSMRFWPRSAQFARSGLSRSEAQERLRQYGKNGLGCGSARIRMAKIPWPVHRRPRHPAARRRRDLRRAVVLRAEFALPYEAIAIFAIVLLNAIMGYVQQARAEQAVAALRQMSATHAQRGSGRPGRASRRRSSCRATSS